MSLGNVPDRLKLTSSPVATGPNRLGVPLPMFPFQALAQMGEVLPFHLTVSVSIGLASLQSNGTGDGMTVQLSPFPLPVQLSTCPLPTRPTKTQSLMNPVLPLPSPAALPQSSVPSMSSSEHERWNVNVPSFEVMDES